MTTFEGIVFGILQGVTEFLPVGARAHHALVPELFGLASPSGILWGALSLSSLLALLIVFRHDWASMISSFIEVLAYRKYPMTLDERMPFFLALACVPPAAARYYLNDQIQGAFSDPLWIAGSLALFALALAGSDYFSRKSKGMFDWNLLDSLWIGFGLTLALIPGAGILTGTLIMGLFRNYRREAATKVAFFAAVPILGASSIVHLRGLDWRAAAPMPDVSWITLAVTFIVSLFFGILTLGGFLKHVQRTGPGIYVGYRIIAAVAVIAWLQFRG